ncbi:MAG: ISL3 family transposase [Polyangiaceae bacterium]
MPRHLAQKKRRLCTSNCTSKPRTGSSRTRTHRRSYTLQHCQRPFTEPVPGVKKGYRTTARYRRAVLNAAEDFADLKTVRLRLRCSAGLLYRIVYEQLELRRRTRLYEWPARVGIDEHYFKRNRRLDVREFVTMVVDLKNARLMELVEGKRGDDIRAALEHIPGRENVKWVALDLCDPYKRFAKDFFPNARLVADKFHVLRLLMPAITKYRRLAAGDRDHPFLRKLLLRNGYRLKHHVRWQLSQWLEGHPELRALYQAKEALHRLYRIRGHRRAAKALTKLTDALALSPLPPLQTLRKTLMRWRKEVLAYFICRLTNARTEGFNGKAKVVKRRAYGYRSFETYRLRLLNACRGSAS